MIDQIVTILSPLIAITALYFSLKKQTHEITKLNSEAANADADTIVKLYALVRQQQEDYETYKKEQEKLYSKLQNEFKVYKEETTLQLADVINENVKLRKWARKLATQLEQAGIIPATYEL